MLAHTLGGRADSPREVARLPTGGSTAHQLIRAIVLVHQLSDRSDLCLILRTCHMWAFGSNCRSQDWHATDVQACDARTQGTIDTRMPRRLRRGLGRMRALSDVRGTEPFWSPCVRPQAVQKRKRPRERQRREPLERHEGRYRDGHVSSGRLAKVLESGRHRESANRHSTEVVVQETTKLKKEQQRRRDHSENSGSSVARTDALTRRNVDHMMQDPSTRRSQNAAAVLLPKEIGATHLGRFRPVACLTTLRKPVGYVCVTTKEEIRFGSLQTAFQVKKVQSDEGHHKADRKALFDADRKLRGIAGTPNETSTRIILKMAQSTVQPMGKSNFGQG